ncbi:MAG: hypothetical protein AB1414_04660 [bacterium]
MEKWREDELTDKIIAACINVHLVNFADYKIDVRRIELEKDE